MKLTVNLNDQAEVVLTASGAIIYNQYLRRFNQVSCKAEGDVIKEQLWCLFQMFGEAIYLGMGEVLFKDCNIMFK